MVSRFIAEHRKEVLAMAATRLRKRPASGAVEAAREKNVSLLLKCVASALRDTEAKGPEAPPLLRGDHISGEQVSFDVDELVFQYESLCHSINERADLVGTLIPSRDQQC